MLMWRSLMLFLARSPVTVLCIMTLSFLGFGYFSINLFFMFKANIDVINQYGVMVLKEGAAAQLLILLCNAFVSVFFYSVWKVCERLLVDWVMKAKSNTPDASAVSKNTKKKKNSQQKSKKELDSELNK